MPPKSAPPGTLRIVSIGRLSASDGRLAGLLLASPKDLYLVTRSDLFVAATYRGCSDGWIPNGGPRSLADAQRLAALTSRIRPDFVTRPVAV